MLRLNVSYSIENIKYNNAPPAHHKSISTTTHRERETYTRLCIAVHANDSARCVLTAARLNIFSFSYLCSYSSLLLPTRLTSQSSVPSSSSSLLLLTLLRLYVFSICAYIHTSVRTQPHHSCRSICGI